MLDITIFGTGSSGNGYCVSDGKTQLLLEVGIPEKKAAPKMNFDFSKVVGILITHEHGDHSKYLKQYLLNTIAPVYLTAGTANALKFEGVRRVDIQPLHEYKIGTWIVTPFHVEHDATDPVGYLIESQAGDRLLYVTDTYFVKYRFKDITQMLVEMNYSSAISQKNVDDGILNPFLERRIWHSHFEMENSLNFIKANTSPSLESVTLIHLSKLNGDPKLFKSKTQEITGVPVTIAKS